MPKHGSLLDLIFRGGSDSNVPFKPLCRLLDSLGFSERVRGDHHIFFKDGVEEIINLQPKGSKAKAYQVKQVRAILVKYGLRE